MTTWQSRHRGPYQLLVTRPSKGQTPIRVEWLAGRSDGDEVEAEAQALLSDPRDRVLRVHVWSEREQQFVMTYPATRGERAAHAKRQRAA